LPDDPVSKISHSSPGSAITLGLQLPHAIPRDVICHLQWSPDLASWRTLASTKSEGGWEGADGRIGEGDSSQLILDVYDRSGFFRFDFEPRPLLAE
jgi:hypothetical protein